MRVFLLVILCAVASKDVVADGENELKRGTFPFMAFLYYPVETILDNNGARLIRPGVLITNNWLLSSGDIAHAFPQKTLLARVGSVNIDSKINFNEDEEEQEREIIFIVRPYNYNDKEWWNADISLLKTLSPFNTTLSVSPAPPIADLDSTEKTCFALIYTKQYENSTESSLTQMFVELLPSTQENCGSYFRKETMVCAADGEDKAISVADPNFCQGNSGGPLICKKSLIGLQTYISDCKPPHLYQMLAGWKQLITFATQEKYLTEPCADICITLSKDPPSLESSSTTILDTKNNVAAESLFGMLNNVLSEKNHNSSDDEVPSKSVTPIEQEPIVNESKIATDLNDMSEEQKYNDTAMLNSRYPKDTTPFPLNEASQYVADDVMDPAEERDRNSHIEAKHQLVRNGASIIIPFMFKYLMFMASILACRN